MSAPVWTWVVEPDLTGWVMAAAGVGVTLPVDGFPRVLFAPLPMLATGGVPTLFSGNVPAARELI